jgi:ketosteroid isomerase-like protein
MRIPPAIKTVRAMLDASEAVNADKYLSHVTEDVVIRPPGFIIGPGEIRGHEEIRAGFERLKGILGSDRQLHLGERRYFLDRADESKVLVGVEITISDKGAPGSFGTQAAMLCTLVGDKVSRLDSWTTREEGLAQLQDPVAVDDV